MMTVPILLTPVVVVLIASLLGSGGCGIDGRRDRNSSRRMARDDLGCILRRDRRARARGLERRRDRRGALCAAAMARAAPEAPRRAWAAVGANHGQRAVDGAGRVA